MVVGWTRRGVVRRGAIHALAKGALLFLFGTLLAGVVVTAALAWSSRRAVEVGLNGGQLRKCPATPNCVGSELQDRAHAVPSIAIEPLEPFAAWYVFQQAVQVTGGTIIEADEHYLHAEYRTPVFRFTDDFEARLDANVGRIHIRSASRVGRSDLGANRRRARHLREVYRRLRNGSLTEAEA